MTMVFKFRMLSDENDRFVRDCEVMYDMNLLALHDFICGQFGYDKTEMASFFTSNGYWEKLQEYPLHDIGGDHISMSNASLGQIIHKNNDRLIYVFDLLNERALYLELIATMKAGDKEKYPQVVLTEGDAPDQHNPMDSTLDDDFDDSICDEAMDGYGSFDENDSYEEE